MNNMSEICKVELENDFNSEYIGITIYNGNPQVIFPRGYKLELDNNGQMKDIRLLIKVFDKYIKRRGNKIHSQDLDDLLQGNGVTFPFSNALWLIRDYEHNKLYKEYLHNYKLDRKGNIDWSRTIKTINPHISNHKLVYLEFSVKEKRNNLNNIIVSIQKYIIEKCIENIGWMYPNVYIDRGNKLPYNKSVCMNILKRELQLTNIDSTKQLISHMIEFLKYVGKDNSNQKLKEYKTKYFMNIWEDMLSNTLSNEDATKYYTNAQWNIGSNISDASNLRPDIILKLENNVYVIDAKYYKYGITTNTNDLPQSSDITKQLCYSSYITSNYGFNSYDSFILPYKSDNEEYFKFVGNATVEIDGFENKRVVCILADIKKIMEQYISMDKSEELKNKIVKIIDNENVTLSKDKK